MRGLRRARTFACDRAQAEQAGAALDRPTPPRDTHHPRGLGDPAGVPGSAAIRPPPVPAPRVARPADENGAAAAAA